MCIEIPLFLKKCKRNLRHYRTHPLPFIQQVVDPTSKPGNLTPETTLWSCAN